MTSRKKSPAEPGLGNGECLASLGLRLFTEERGFLLGCKHGPEGSAPLAAAEAGLVTLVGYLSDNGSINCGMRRGGIGLPPTFFGSEFDNFFDAKFRIRVDENHKGGSKPGESRAATGYWCFRTTVMARSRWSLVLFASLARVAALGNRCLLTRHGGRLRNTGRRGRRVGNRGRLRASLGRGALDVGQVGLRALSLEPPGVLMRTLRPVTRFLASQPPCGFWASIRTGASLPVTLAM